MQDKPNGLNIMHTMICILYMKLNMCSCMNMARILHITHCCDTLWMINSIDERYYVILMSPTKRPEV